MAKKKLRKEIWSDSQKPWKQLETWRKTKTPRWPVAREGGYKSLWKKTEKSWSTLSGWIKIIPSKLSPNMGLGSVVTWICRWSCSQRSLFSAYLRSQWSSGTGRLGAWATFLTSRSCRCCHSGIWAFQAPNAPKTCSSHTILMLRSTSTVKRPLKYPE